MTLFEDFTWRGILHNYTNGAEEYLAKNPTATVYIGFDPTAASLHVGSLLPAMCLARLQKAGYHVIAIVGGGTGMIGDPSGKSAERNLLTLEQIEVNLQGIKSQLSRFLDFTTPNNPAKIINNADWLASISMMEFLRDVGKHFTTNYMRAKESVKRREEDGISFTEFSYMLLQAYDFYELNKRYQCSVQMGGSDQWGNITAGTDLIGKRGGSEAHGLTWPLVTTASGVKFGKTEAGAVWLDAALTSPYAFYQFWLNTPDTDVIKYLKFFSWKSKEEITALEEELKTAPEKRSAQKALASEITQTVHGADALQKALNATSALFGGSLEGLTATEIKEIFKDVPSSVFALQQLTAGETGILDFLTITGVTESKSAARQLLKDGGVYINGNKISGIEYRPCLSDSIEHKYIVVRKGKKNYHLINLE